MRDTEIFLSNFDYLLSHTLGAKKQTADPFESAAISFFSSPERTILELPTFTEFKRWLREEADDEQQKLEVSILV